MKNGVEHHFMGLPEKVHRPPEYLEALHTKLTSDPPHQQQDDHNQKNQSKSTAGIVSPAFTVRPGGQCADEDEYQNNDQYRTHVFPPFLFRISSFMIILLLAEVVAYCHPTRSLYLSTFL
jgi:hypothetical protein